MKRNNLLSLALAVAFLGAMAPAALAQTYAPGREKPWDPQTQDQRWRDDRSWQSGRADFEGRWVAQNRNDARFGGNARATTLPNFLLIDQQRRIVRITDRRSNVLQVIALDRGNRLDRQRTSFLSGELRGQRLVAHGIDARGRSMTQTMVLRDGGRTMIVRTEVQQGRAGRMFQTEKVYQRA